MSPKFYVLETVYQMLAQYMNCPLNAYCFVLVAFKSIRSSSHNAKLKMCLQFSVFAHYDPPFQNFGIFLDL